MEYIIGLTVIAVIAYLMVRMSTPPVNSNIVEYEQPSNLEVPVVEAAPEVPPKKVRKPRAPKVEQAPVKAPAASVKKAAVAKAPAKSTVKPVSAAKKPAAIKTRSKKV